MLIQKITMIKLLLNRLFWFCFVSLGYLLPKKKKKYPEITGLDPLFSYRIHKVNGPVFYLSDWDPFRDLKSFYRIGVPSQTYRFSRARRLLLEYRKSAIKLASHGRRESTASQLGVGVGIRRGSCHSVLRSPHRSLW